jgi:hypothetical protein
MILTGFKNRAAISAIFATAVGVLAVSICPVAHSTDEESWGAIAVSQDAQHVGVSKNSPNELSANELANFYCNSPTCNTMISFKYPECGAVVMTEDQFYRDLGSSQHEAEQNAINQSPKATTRVVRSQCAEAPYGRR